MKKKNPYQLLIDTMGLYKICVVISIICAAISAVFYIIAYIYVYDIAEALLAYVREGMALEESYIQAKAMKIFMSICAGYGMYGFSLLFSHITAFNTALKLKNKMVRHIGNLPLGFHDTHSSGSLRKIIEKNTETAETLIAHQIPNTTQAVVLPIVLAYFMLSYNVWMSISCIIPVIIGFILMMAIMMKGGADFVSKYQKASADISNAAVEYVRGVSVVKTFGQSADSFNRYKNAVLSFQEYVLKFALSMENGDSLYNTSINSLFLTLIPTTIYLFNKSGGDKNIFLNFIFFASLLPMASSILKKMMSNSSESIIVKESLQVLEEILAYKPMDYKSDEREKGYEIRLCDVSFSYGADMPLALDNIDLTVPEGSVTALVGPSGSGKSTIGSLIARYWDVNSGKITIGGTDVRDMSLEHLNSIVSVVFQESTMLKATIRKNVSLYRPDATDEQIMRALKAAQCMDILEKLPNGLDTVYGARGTYLSGGEMQRLAIARAILKDAPIVVLDEATAFTDSENEYLIRKALKELLKGKTVIMIAHRMSTVRDADKICVIDNGHLIEEGTHDELMDKEGAYAGLVREFNTTIEWKLGREALA